MRLRGARLIWNVIRHRVKPLEISLICWPNSPGAVGNRVVLGFKLSQWTYSRRRGIRDCCRSLYQQDLARSARVRDVDSNFMDLSRRLFASRAWRALAD